MKPSRTLGQLITAFVGVSTVSAAWPGFLPDIDALVVRANSQTTSAQPSQTATPGSTGTNSAAALTTGDLNTASFNPSSTGAAATGTVRGSNSTNSTHHQTFDPQSPAGTITMMTPAATTLALFKIGDHVTYVWNYTNLLASPTAVDVLAYDSGATLTHTLTQNMSFAVPNTLVWDTGLYQAKNGASKGLRAVMYTLTIYDADSAPTATAEAGYLAVYNGLQFGLYSPQAYTPLSEWKCAACSGAQNLGAAGAIGFAVTAAFAAGVGLLIL